MLVHKITNGYVVQVFDTTKEEFVSQEFVAGESEVETADGDPTDEEVKKYLDFGMVQPTAESTQQTLERLASECAPENLLRVLSEIYGKRAEGGKGRFDAVVSSYIDAALDRIQQKLPGNNVPYDFQEAGLTIGEAVEKRHEHSPGAPLHLVVDAVISDKVVEDRIRGWREAKTESRVAYIVTGIDNLGDVKLTETKQDMSRSEMLTAFLRMTKTPGIARVILDAAI